MIELPADLPADLVPLAWLLGEWEGTGVIDYHVEDHRFTGEFSHRVRFSHDGGDALTYVATASFLEEDGTVAAPLLSETGYWRIDRHQTDADAGPALLPARISRASRTVEDVEALRNKTDGFNLAVALSHEDGSVELYSGTVTGPRIDLETTGRLSSSGAKPYGAASRMYGLVQGHLLWAWDIAALGSDLASHASARLAKVTDSDSK